MMTVIKILSFRLVVYVALSLLCSQVIDAQKILGYGQYELTASVNYNGFLYGIYKKHYSTLPRYPIKGTYSPTHYSRYDEVPPGCGVCNYIYIPTKSKLLPGRQYRLSFTVKVGKAFSQMPYFKSHFGVALSSDLIKNNYFGLWSKPFVPIDIDTTEVPGSNSFIFRPLCTSNYLVLGVFQGETMDKQDCFACQYGFELYNLQVEQYDDPQAEFVYMCDAFEEERLKKNLPAQYETDTLYFVSGSAEIQEKYLAFLDSIPGKLGTKQDLITLYAYTDKEGTDNYALGAARNAAVRQELVLRGVDTSRILLVNYGESKASDRISQDDRRVEIDINRGKLYQKYYTEALEAAKQGDYRLAQTKITQWLKIVPPENAIYALFDCWGEGEEIISFRHDLVKNIKSRLFYKRNDLKFTLDSLSCEDQKGRTLSMFLAINRLPDYVGNCYFDIDSLGDVSHQNIIDRIYAEHGFPTVKEVGERGNLVLPFMIIHVRDTSFQKRYLPIVQKACEEQIITWENYATLYDKINVRRNGLQRYGTQWIINKLDGPPRMFPFEDEEMVAEYRKQVGLVPLSDF
jgi:outer membrane protein OmpA-like peptidoglycan-associated protein